MPDTPKIVVVGSFVVGITFGAPRLPVLGETLMGDSFDLGAGGKGANQAIGATRLGADVHLLACVGDDLFADMAFDIFRREGMALTHLHRMSGIHTGVGVVTLLPSGENWIVADYGANLRMTPAHVDAAEELIAQSDIVLTQCEVPLETVAHAMHLGRKHGAMTIWNPAPAKPVSASLLANVDLLTPNETETRILLGLPPDDPTPTQELARRLLGFGIQQIVVTKGKQGALIVTPDRCEELPAIPVKVIDPTGCGDCFNAALTVGLGQGMSLAAAARQATYAGAYMATHLGVINGLPTRAQLDEFRASHQI